MHFFYTCTHLHGYVPASDAHPGLRWSRSNTASDTHERWPKSLRATTSAQMFKLSRAWRMDFKRLRSTLIRRTQLLHLPVQVNEARKAPFFAHSDSWHCERRAATLGLPSNQVRGPSSTQTKTDPKPHFKSKCMRFGWPPANQNASADPLAANLLQKVSSALS